MLEMNFEDENIRVLQSASKDELGILHLNIDIAGRSVKRYQRIFVAFCGGIIT